MLGFHFKFNTLHLTSFLFALLVCMSGCSGCSDGGSKEEADSDPDPDPDFLCINSEDCDEDGVPATCDEDDADADNMACVENPLPPGCEDATDCDEDGVSRVCDVNDSDASVTTLKPECVENNPACAIPLDCDADGLSNACDVNPFDAAVVEIKKPECAAQDVDNDGFWDDTCSSRDANGDGALSSDEIANRVLCDNCVGIANTDQADGNGNLAGDACDALNCTDTDEDQVCDEINGVRVDNCPTVFNPIQTANLDGDSLGDVCDDDQDGDGVTVAGGDCDDRDALRFPGNPAEDVIADGIDLNCDGNDLPENCLFAHPNILGGGNGSFNQPYSLEGAVTAAVEGQSICLYEGVFSRSVTINKKVTLIPGFSCLGPGGTELTMNPAGDAVQCTSQLQVRKCDPFRADRTLDENCLARFEGEEGAPSVTLTADATLDGLHIKAHKCEVALKIIDSSPTVKNSLIESPICLAGDVEEESDAVSKAVDIVADAGSASPLLEKNIIRAGETITEYENISEQLPYSTSGIVARFLTTGSDPNDQLLKPTIRHNQINVGTAQLSCVGISLIRLSPYSGSMLEVRKNDNYRPIISDNIINVDTCAYALAIGAQSLVPVKIFRNKLTIKGSNYVTSPAPATTLSGIGCRGVIILTDSPVDRAYMVYNNLFKICPDARPGYIEGIEINGNVKTRIYSNTFVLGEGIGVAGLSNPASAGVYSNREENRLSIINNIFMATTDQTGGDKGAIMIRDLNGDGTIGVILEHVKNNHFDSNFYGGFRYNTGESWFSLEDTLSGSITSARLFSDTNADRISGNIEGHRPNLSDTYRPNLLSPAIDAGYRFGNGAGLLPGPTLDLDNQLRGNNPDIGCYEYSATPLIGDFTINPSDFGEMNFIPGGF